MRCTPIPCSAWSLSHLGLPLALKRSLRNTALGIWSSASRLSWRVRILMRCTSRRRKANTRLAAIAAGKHVLVEKPFTVTAEEARTVSDAARSAGVLAMAGRWHLRVATAVGGSASRLRLRLDRARGHPLGGRVPRPAPHRLRRPHLRRVGGPPAWTACTVPSRPQGSSAHCSGRGRRLRSTPPSATSRSRVTA